MTLSNVFAVAPVVLDGLGAVVELALVTWVVLFPVRVELFFGISCSQTDGEQVFAVDRFHEVKIFATLTLRVGNPAPQAYEAFPLLAVFFR